MTTCKGRIETERLHGRAAFRGLAFVLGFVGCGLCLTARAEYAIEWFTIDGGGGTSSGGGYAVSGTVGQPDACEPMTGGTYAVTGGFWVFRVVQGI